MIPKIIHYTWFSGEPFPDKIKQCIESWKLHNPQYSLKLWDMNAICEIDSPFLKEAIAMKKWAYAADFVRLYAVYNEGGIYLDTDCYLYKSFDDFLDRNAFIGKENSIHFESGFSAQYLSSHCFGAEKNHPFIGACLSYFTDRHFITSRNENLPVPLRLNYVLLPYIQAEIARLWGYDWKPLNQKIQHCKDGLVIYPTDFFDALSLKNCTICKHLALGSWRVDVIKEPEYNLKYKITWRIIWVLKFICQKFNYVLLKIE